jgi:hypothetical protein
MARKAAKTPTQSRAIDRVVTDLNIRGRTARQISEALLIDHEIVIGRRGVQARIERMNKSAEVDRTQECAREISVIDWTQNEAMDAWIRSQQPHEISLAEQNASSGSLPKGKGGQAGAQPAERTKTSIRREGQVGDPAFLNVVVKCSERRARLRGLDAPASISFPGVDGLVLYHPEEDLPPGSPDPNEGPAEK